MKDRTSKITLFFLIVVAELIIGSCKNDNRDYVPYVPVDLTLDLQADLAHLGNLDVAIVTPGTTGLGVLQFSNPKLNPIYTGQAVHGNGIIIYRLSVTEFFAYDITCTFNAEVDYCPLEMGDNWLLPECPCCESKFNLLLEGAPRISGPAALPLQQYNTFIRNNRLYIKN